MEWIILLNFVTIFVSVLVFVLPINRGKAFVPRFVLFAAASCAVYGLLLWGTDFLSFDAYWFVRPFAAFGLICACVRFCTGLDWEETLYLSIWSFLAREFCFDATQVVTYYLDINVFTDADGIVLTLVFDLAVLLGLYFFVARRLSVEGHLVLTREQLRSALLLACLVTVIKPIAIWARQTEGYNAFTLFQVICGFFVMAVLYSRSMEEKHTAVEQELATQRQLWHQRKVQLEAAQENLDLLNCKYHDLKHYIAALRSQNSLQDSASVLDELEESVKVFDCAVRTGNTILDTVLTEKSLLCERRQITMTCVADGKLLQGMNTVDLYALLGNGVDNAVECVSQLSDPERRVISIEIFRVGDLVKIQIENFYGRQPQFEGDLPATTKSDREYHGFGLKSIRRTAEKYGGYMSVQAEDGLFLLHILLPAERVVGSDSSDYAEKSTS